METINGMEVSEEIRDVGLLVGLDMPQALVSLETRRDDDYEPCHLLGLETWEQYKREENLCLECNVLKGDGYAIFVEDRKVLSLRKTSVKKVKGRYQLPIAFRLQDPNLPDNKETAMGHLRSLGRRLQRDKE